LRGTALEGETPVLAVVRRRPLDGHGLPIGDVPLHAAALLVPPGHGRPAFGRGEERLRRARLPPAPPGLPPGRREAWRVAGPDLAGRRPDEGGREPERDTEVRVELREEEEVRGRARRRAERDEPQGGQVEAWHGLRSGARGARRGD
ncbi:hypothetical protein THAOC_21805, partial [Thalassiosira oceanica]